MGGLGKEETRPVPTTVLAQPLRGQEGEGVQRRRASLGQAGGGGYRSSPGRVQSVCQHDGTAAAAAGTEGQVRWLEHGRDLAGPQEPLYQSGSGYLDDTTYAFPQRSAILRSASEVGSLARASRIRPEVNQVSIKACSKEDLAPHHAHAHFHHTHHHAPPSSASASFFQRRSSSFSSSAAAAHVPGFPCPSPSKESLFKRPSDRGPVMDWVNMADRVSLTFKDDQTEEEYRLFFARKHAPMWRVYLVLAAFATILLCGLELIERNPPVVVVAAALIPIGLVLHFALALVYSFVRTMAVFSRHVHGVSFSVILWTTVLGVYVYNMILPKDGADLFKAAFMFIVSMSMGLVLLRLRFVWSVLSCVINWTTFMVLAAVFRSSTWTPGSYVFIGITCLVMMVFIAMNAYESERSTREQFVRSQHYIRTNAQLVHQLMTFQRSYHQRVADFDSPLEKAISILKSVLSDPVTKTPHVKAVSDAIKCLNASNILVPDLQSQVDTGRVPVDHEQQSWLFTVVTKRMNMPSHLVDRYMRRRSTGILETRHGRSYSHYREHKQPSSQPQTANQSTVLYNAPDSTVMALQVADDAFLASENAQVPSHQPVEIVQRSESRRTSVTSTPDTGCCAATEEEEEKQRNHTSSNLRDRSRRPSYLAGSEGCKRFEDFTVIAEMNPQVPNQVLALTMRSALGAQSPTTNGTSIPARQSKKINLRDLSHVLSLSTQWNWPIFDFSTQCNDLPILPFALHTFHDLNLFETFAIPMDRFLRCIATLERGYHQDLTYHNAIHACDVLHGCLYFARNPYVKNIMTDVELLALLFASIIHDHDHGGFNNNFLIETADSRAILYNDRSVLESHHLSSAFRVLYKEDNNFICNMTRADQKLFRELVIDLVLATDLQQHFSLLSVFKSKIGVADAFNPHEVKEDRFLLWKMLIKCADVCNPTKEWSLCKEWTDRVSEEFFRQGDEERRLSFPISAFMDRQNPNKVGCQISFIDFICIPIFEALDSCLCLSDIVAQLHDNRGRWIRIKNRTSQQSIASTAEVSPTSAPTTVAVAAQPTATFSSTPVAVTSKDPARRVKPLSLTPSRSGHGDPSSHPTTKTCTTTTTTTTTTSTTTTTTTTPTTPSKASYLVTKKSAAVSPTQPTKPRDVARLKSTSGLLNHTKRLKQQQQQPPVPPPPVPPPLPHKFCTSRSEADLPSLPRDHGDFDEKGELDLRRFVGAVNRQASLDVSRGSGALRLTNPTRRRASVELMSSSSNRGMTRC